MARFLESLKSDPPNHVAGTAVYLTSEASALPRALTLQLQFQQTLHERIVILTFARTETPRLTPEERISVEPIADGISRVVARYGFMEQPNTMAALRLAEEHGLEFDPGNTVYIVGHDTPIVTGKKGFAMWRKRLFALMARNSQFAYRHFDVPSHRLLEVGSQTEL